jgi:polyisoprenoid-binding protein YceI
MKMRASFLVAASAAVALASRSATTAHGSQWPAGVAAGSVAPVVTLIADTTGAEVRYRVRERLLGKDLDNDAIGVTRAVSGQIALAADGSVIPGESKITIDVTGLKSDQSRRDGYVQRRLLETEKYPTVTFEPTAVQGGPKSIPTTGTGTFTLVGNLTVRGVTRPTTWKVNAKYAPTAVTGSAATAFTFAEFEIAQPKVPILLSVSDTIRLEYDFNFAVRR